MSELLVHGYIKVADHREEIKIRKIVGKGSHVCVSQLLGRAKINKLSFQGAEDEPVGRHP